MEGVRAPKQQRSRDTYDRLVDAGTELLAETGYDGFTLAEARRRAGISHGRAYWLFESKDALILAIHQRYQERTAALGDQLAPEQWADVSLEDLIDSVIRLLTKPFGRETALLRALNVKVAQDPEFMHIAVIQGQIESRAFRRLLAPRLREAGHPDPEGAAAQLYTTIISACCGRVAFPGFHTGPRLSWKRFVDGLVEMAIAQVAMRLPPAP